MTGKCVCVVRGGGGGGGWEQFEKGVLVRQYRGVFIK